MVKLYMISYTLLHYFNLCSALCSVVPYNISATEHYVSPVRMRGTVCSPIFELHGHNLRSRTGYRRNSVLAILYKTCTIFSVTIR